MNIQQLKFVIAVAESGSFRAAAKRLYIAQPSLSRGIKELEKELSTELFQRTAKGAKLTNSGYLFYEEARKITKQFSALNERFAPKNAAAHLVVSGQHYDFLAVIVSRILALDAAEQTIRIAEGTTLEVIEDVETYKSELGVIYLDPQNQSGLLQILAHQGLEYETVTSFRPHIYLSRKHPLATYQKIRQSDLTPYPQVRFLQESSYRQLAEDPLAQPKKGVTIQASDRGTLNEVLQAGNAYASGSGLVSDPDEQELVLVPLADGAESEIGIVTRKNQKLSEHAALFTKELQNYLKTS
ncbi:LysR family transcriptional regulator [Enterococcus hirae]|nr:LysR family transcriptional regulator [Enterococcus hirae]